MHEKYNAFQAFRNQDENYDIQPIQSAVFSEYHCFDKTYNRNITLDFLSEKYFISKQALIKKFKKYIDQTPIDYLNGVRIRQSKELLKNSIEPIGEISEKCGFSNIYYFSKIFKKSTGMSPKEYRNALDI